MIVYGIYLNFGLLDKTSYYLVNYWEVFTFFYDILLTQQEINLIKKIFRLRNKMTNVSYNPTLS